jgi:integrase
MARKASGQLVEVEGRSGVTFAARFRAYGKRRYVTFGSSRDGWTRQRAAEELENLLADVRRGIWIPPEAAKPAPEVRVVPTFHEFASEWFEGRRLEGGRNGTGLTPNGEADLRWRLSNHLLPYFKSLRLDEISVECIDEFRRAKVREGGLSSTSINKLISTMASILELAVEYEHIQRNPARGRRRRLPSVTPPRTYLDRASQVVALLEAGGDLDARGRSRPWRRALLATLTLAGLRIDEALSLRWADVDLANGRILVRGTKTAAAARVVDLLPLLRDELTAYAAARASRQPHDLVFATATGGKHSATNVRRRVLGPAVSRANEKLAGLREEPIPAGTTPHSLRRTFASILVARGDDPAYAMSQLGHTSPHLTLALYARSMQRRNGEKARWRALVDGCPLRTDGIPISPQATSADGR